MIEISKEDLDRITNAGSEHVYWQSILSIKDATIHSKAQAIKELVERLEEAYTLLWCEKSAPAAIEIKEAINKYKQS